jgi:3-oxoacyl-[acyl-carrier protein] reductase
MDGIGAHYCARFVEEGAFVVLADSNQEAIENLAQRLNEGYQRLRAVAVHANLTAEDDTTRIAQITMENFDRIDVLVNNVSAYSMVKFEDLSYEQWQQTVSANLNSAFLTIKAVLPYMKQQPAGKIINVSTNLVWIGLPQMAHYIAAKAGIIGLTRSLARELGEFNITVNTFAPGTIPPARVSERTRARFHAIIDAQALKRQLIVDDLIGPMIFLASSESDFITGQVLSVDGGLILH